MKPSWFLEEEDGDHHRWLQRQAVLEGWGVDCPEGTIPIIRKTSRDGPDVKDRSYINRFSSNHSIKVVTEAHEVRENPHSLYIFEHLQTHLTRSISALIFQNTCDHLEARFTIDIISSS